jgi:lysophospholipase L1-like esterase
MIDCGIIGDSIAVGTAAFKQECVADYAVDGLNSWQWNKRFKDANLSASMMIISLGTNDHQYVDTRKELETMRKRVTANRVFWVLPMGNNPKSGVSLEEIQAAVVEIAEKHGDIIIATKRLQKDGIHPSWAGYKELAAEAKF